MRVDFRNSGNNGKQYNEFNHNNYLPDCDGVDEAGSTDIDFTAELIADCTSDDIAPDTASFTVSCIFGTRDLIADSINIGMKVWISDRTAACISCSVVADAADDNVRCPGKPGLSISLDFPESCESAVPSPGLTKALPSTITGEGCLLPDSGTLGLARILCEVTHIIITKLITHFIAITQ